MRVGLTPIFFARSFCVIPCSSSASGLLAGGLAVLKYAHNQPFTEFMSAQKEQT